MMMSFLKCFSLPILIFVSIVLMTYPELRFHAAGVEKLTKDKFKTIANVSFDQYYEIDHPMAFKLDIENKDGRMATALWPEEPFSTILVMVNYRDDALREKTRFRGRLLRCLNQCLSDEMLVDMDYFQEQILVSFPTYKPRLSKLPQYVLDVSKKPLGLEHYLKSYLWHYLFLGVSLLVGLVFFLWGLIKKRR